MMDQLIVDAGFTGARAEYRNAKLDWFLDEQDGKEVLAESIFHSENDGTHIEILMRKDLEVSHPSISFEILRLFQIGGSWELSIEYRNSYYYDIQDEDDNWLDRMKELLSGLAKAIK